jgi:hypothetical protein
MSTETASNTPVDIQTIPVTQQPLSVVVSVSTPPPVDELAPIPRKPVMSADALRSIQDSNKTVKIQRKAAELSSTISVHNDWWRNVLQHASDLQLDNVHENVAAAAKVSAQEDQSFVDYELSFTRNLDYDHYVAMFPSSRAAVTYKTCTRDRGNSVHLDAAFDSLKVEFARRVFAKCGVRDVCASIRHHMPGVKVELRSRLEANEPVVIRVSWKKEKKTVKNRMKKWIVTPICRFIDSLPIPQFIF